MAAAQGVVEVNRNPTPPPTCWTDGAGHPARPSSLDQQPPASMQRAPPPACSHTPPAPPSPAPAPPQVIPPPWLRLFSPREVNQLLGGGEAAVLDVDDMQAHAQYRWCSAVQRPWVSRVPVALARGCVPTLPTWLQISAAALGFPAAALFARACAPCGGARGACWAQQWRSALRAHAVIIIAACLPPLES